MKRSHISLLLPVKQLSQMIQALIAFQRSSGLDAGLHLTLVSANLQVKMVYIQESSRKLVIVIARPCFLIFRRPYRQELYQPIDEKQKLYWYSKKFQDVYQVTIDQLALHQCIKGMGGYGKEQYSRICQQKC